MDIISLPLKSIFSLLHGMWNVLQNEQKHILCDRKWKVYKAFSIYGDINVVIQQ